MDRSSLAAKLIDEGLRRYALDTLLRQFAAGPGNEGRLNSTEDVNLAAAVA
jgi:hypothetical protein